MKKIIVIASSNKHKVKEYKQIFSKLQINVLSIKEILGFVPKVLEDKKTLKENAIKKALEMSRYLNNSLVMSDDTGLEIDALNGEPGVFSARYAGHNASFNSNIEKVLNKLQSQKNRKARFVCIIAFAKKNDGLLGYFEGIVEGSIVADYKLEKNSFGYDPIFVPKNYTKTFSQMTLNEKNIISHRANALKKLFASKNLQKWT